MEKYILQFYRTHHYQFIWLDESQPNRLSQWRDVFLRTEEDDAIKLPKFPLAPFLSLINRYESWHATDSVDMELSASICFLQYGNLCWNGLPDHQIKKTGWNSTAKRISYLQMLEWLLSKPHLTSNPPNFRQYGLLKKKLHELKSLVGQKNNPVLPEQQKYPSVGDTGMFVSKLINYLKYWQILPDANSNQFDSAVWKSIVYLQKRFGLKPTGNLNRELLRMMNVSMHQRIQQIIVNMERCRWIKEEISPMHIVINIPDFSYYLVENQKRKWVKKIIVGKEYQPTAIFNGSLQHIVFCPYWNIPPGILKKEILPLVNRHPDYLSSHHMEWYGNGIRQLPGPDNPLGNIKFLFPNRYNMYMHDTPGKQLFKQNKRAYSHGCIRIENAKELALFILSKQGDWTEEKINQILNTGKEKRVTLKNEIPVNITYQTCWVDEAGEIQFRNDVYGYDKKLMDLLVQ